MGKILLIGIMLGISGCVTAPAVPSGSKVGTGVVVPAPGGYDVYCAGRGAGTAACPAD
jgi:hypothetical protein